MTAHSSIRRPAKRTTRKPRSRTLEARIADAAADAMGQLFVWLGRRLISLPALLIASLRLPLIMIGAAVSGFWIGARDEYRLIREEWRQDRAEQTRLVEIIEAEWQRQGLSPPEARARAAHLPDDQNPDLMVDGTAFPGKEVLKRVGLAAIEKENGR